MIKTKTLDEIKAVMENAPESLESVESCRRMVEHCESPEFLKDNPPNVDFVKNGATSQIVAREYHYGGTNLLIYDNPCNMYFTPNGTPFFIYENWKTKKTYALPANWGEDQDAQTALEQPHQFSPGKLSANHARKWFVWIDATSRITQENKKTKQENRQKMREILESANFTESINGDWWKECHGIHIVVKLTDRGEIWFKNISPFNMSEIGELFGLPAGIL